MPRPGHEDVVGRFGRPSPNAGPHSRIPEYLDEFEEAKRVLGVLLGE
jgi:hypothetical protein